MQTTKSITLEQTVRYRYSEIRKQTMKLIEPLQSEDFTPQSAVFASPPKWHIAHTTWFFEEMILSKYLPEYQVFNPEFGFLFNSYYNSIGERVERNARGLISRPTVQEVMDYRTHVDHNMSVLLSNHISTELADLIELGLNHEQQHQELLLTDLKFTFSLNPTFPVYNEEIAFTNQFNSTSEWIDLEEGIYPIGATGNGFSFDNEKGYHNVYLHAFSISKGLVTNADYIEFMEAGAYENHTFWLDEGWAWVSDSKSKSPLYWKKINHQWHQYTLSGFKPVNPDALLTHVNFYEASAFAFWKGCRLPTEFEWEAASDLFDWGKAWEWTASAYLAYPFFKIAKGAVGEYNGKFMVNQMVLRGASPVTASGHSRKTYRNFFHPHYQWQFSGIRLAKHIE